MAIFDKAASSRLADFLLYLLDGADEEGGAAEHRAAGIAHDEPIAIVGLACRYPGGIGSPEELWQLSPRAATRSASSPATAAGT